MRSLSSTLEATQKKATRRPYVKVEVHDRIGGIPRYNWERIHEGTEADYFHAACCPADGSLLRFRVDPSDNKLHLQKVQGG